MRSSVLRVAVVATAAAALVALSGCSGGAPAADRGLVFATGEPDHLTPGRQTIAYDQARALFSPLVDLDDEGEVTNVVAKSVTSDDATNWTITLKPWTFSNGEQVTAESYVKAWNTVAYGPNAWENAGQLAAIVGYGDVHPNEGEPTAKELSGLKVTGDRSFTVELAAPDAQFPLQLSASQTAFFPMPEAAYDDLKAYDRKPIGNGPYEMTTAWKADTEFTVKAWSGYRGTKPLIDSVTFRSYTDQNTAYTDVLAGNADVVFVPPSKLTSAKGDFGDRLHTFQAPGIDYLGFPLDDARYSDVRIRQAVSMAIDRKAVNTAVYGGLYSPATAFTPAAMAGTPDGLCGELCELHPAKAKALLAEAGGFDGQMTIVYPGGLGADDLFQAYANQIRQNLGITDVVAKPTTDFADFASQLTDKKVDGPHFGHWGALYPSQQNTLRALFTAAGGCQICTAYSSPDVDALLAKADAASSADEASRLYADTQKRILEDFPVAPTFSNRYSYVTSDRVSSLPAVSGSAVIAKTRLAG